MTLQYMPGTFCQLIQCGRILPAIEFLESLGQYHLITQRHGRFLKINEEIIV